MAWAVTLVAVVLCVAALRGLLPSPSGRPGPLARATTRARDAWRRRWARRHPRPPDPFAALRLQTRLGILAEHIRMLEADDDVYAKAHRLVAARAAYDDLLDEACALAGVPLDPDRPRGDDRRWEEELALSARGWTW
ncbi:hypothetical protein [Thalassiella azotivora]